MYIYFNRLIDNFTTVHVCEMLFSCPCGFNDFCSCSCLTSVPDINILPELNTLPARI